MATLTIKNIPEPLVKLLKQHVVRHRRSLRDEIIACQEQKTRCRPFEAEVLLARAWAVRRAPNGIRLTDRFLDDLKRSRRS